MLTKSDLADPTVIEGWLRDMGLTPTRRTDPGNNWNLEFTVSGASQLVISCVNPKSIPRAIMLVCGMAAAPDHLSAYSKLDEARRTEFWRQLRTTLTREFVEFQIDGTPVSECPKMLRLSAVRFDDGLTLDSFARSLSSVCKACADAVAHFTDRLGDARPPADGEFAFKKLATQ